MSAPPQLRIGLLAALAACVPAEPDKEPPRGGISITFAASEATAGKPFVTNDGWTVTIDKTAFRAGATGYGIVGDDGSGYSGYGGARPHLLDPRVLCELRVTQLPVAPATVSVQLQSGSPSYKDDALDDACGVDAATVERFRHYADDEAPTNEKDGRLGFGSYYNNAPSLYFAARAEKNGVKKHVELGLALNMSPYDQPGTYDASGVWHPKEGFDPSHLVAVRQNEGTPVRFGVHYEWLFSRGFEPLAAADGNGDGEITGPELDAAPGDCGANDVDDEPRFEPPSYICDGTGCHVISSDDDDDTSTPSTPQCRSLLKVLRYLGKSVIDQNFMQ